MPGGDRDLGKDFDALVGQLDYPMFIVITRSLAGELAGCLVGFATQCSVGPPRFLICLSQANRTHQIAREAAAIGVHLVPSSAAGLAELFGGETGDEVDKFAHCEWEEGERGVPLLTECPNAFVGSILERHDLGDHVGLVLEPIAVRRGGAQAELGFGRARQIEPGHQP